MVNYKTFYNSFLVFKKKKKGNHILILNYL